MKGDMVAALLPRRDIVAICAFLNRKRPRPVDSSHGSLRVTLERLAAAARMQ